VFFYHFFMKISIITVVFNAEADLCETIKSVSAQTAREHIEYIVIDGGSKDGTKQAIIAQQNEIDRWISEPDKGLYDAMNKGLAMATGDFVWFVNAGDTIAAPDTTAQILAQASPKTDILYGEVAIVDAERKILGTRSDLSTQKLPTTITWQSLRYGMVVSHQGFLVRRSIAPLYMMQNLAADIDWVIVCLKKAAENKQQIVQISSVLAHFQTGGISTQRHKQSLKDRFTVLQQHFGFFQNLLAHGFIMLRAAFRKLVD
jgi:glycosyltransferase involved in cell wall biosynthesis